jgi:uncharacterized membrane protein
MAGYISNLKKDIARWEADGLIDAETAAALRRDADTRPGGVSFGQILAILAAALIGAAILLLIAANWEAFPRLLRVALIFAVIAGGYIGGAVLKGRGSDGFAEALYIIGAVGFGAGIALVAQMYHLSGDETQAILTWCIGTAVAALALRSGPLTSGAVLLAGAWMLMATDEASGLFGQPPLLYLALVAALWAVSVWTQGRAARHLILLSLMGYCVLLYLDESSLVAPTILAAVSAAAFGLWAYAEDEAERFAMLGEGGLPVQALLGFIVGLSPIQFEYQDQGIFLMVVIIVFAGIIAALLLGGRENRMLRWLAYAAFTYEVGYVYIVLVASMIGTAGLFLTAGFVVAALAWFISRMEKRMRLPQPAAGGAS